MTTLELISAIFIFLIAIVTAIISFNSFNNKGYLFNNAYFYATKEEKETMDKKPYYRQSAIVFLLLTFIAVVIGVSIVLKNDRVLLLEIPLIILAVIYVIVSSIRISKEDRW